jgi:ABC-2 type transport system permease protein
MKWTLTSSGLRDSLHAEWTKVRTAPDQLWLLIAVVALTVMGSVAVVATISCSSIGVGPGCAADRTKLSLTGIDLGQAAVAVLAVLAMGNEYSTGMIHVTLAAIPRRSVALAGKAIVLTGLVIGTATVAVLACLLAGRLILPEPTSGDAGPGPGSVLRAAIGSVLYLALIALLSLGTAAAVRDSATAIATVLGLLYIFPIIAQLVSDPDLRRHLEQVAPMSAGMAVQATTQLDQLPIGPWAGLGVLAGWAATALITGWGLLQWRDA